MPFGRCFRFHTDLYWYQTISSPMKSEPQTSTTIETAHKPTAVVPRGGMGGGVEEFKGVEVDEETV